MPASTSSKRLAIALESQVLPEINRRGVDYRSKRLVVINRSSKRIIEATVRGTWDYCVAIEYWPRDHAIGFTCDCPFVQRNVEICKHMWATLLEAESRGLLMHIPADPLPQVYVDGFQDDEDDSETGAMNADPAADLVEFITSHGLDVKLGRDLKDWAQRQRPDRAAKEQRSSGKPKWREQLDALTPAAPRIERDFKAGLTQVIYVLNPIASAHRKRLVVQIATRTRKTNGKFGALKFESHYPIRVQDLRDPADLHLVTWLHGCEHAYTYANHREQTFGEYGDSGAEHYFPPAAIVPALCRTLASTGRCTLRLEGKSESINALHWDESTDCWRFETALHPCESHKNCFALQGSLRRGAAVRPIEDAALIVPGLVVFGNTMSEFDGSASASDWAHLLRAERAIHIGASHVEDFLATLPKLGCCPPIAFAPELKVEVLRATPKPRLKLEPDEESFNVVPPLRAELAFEYDGHIAAAEAGSELLKVDARRLVRRDEETERDAIDTLLELGFRRPSNSYGRVPKPGEFQLAPKRMPDVVRKLNELGWHVVAEGKLIRPPSSCTARVASGIDWFELQGEARFGDQVISLPQLLKALQRGESNVVLDDGSLGMLPEQWLSKFAGLADFGDSKSEHVRFERAQVGLLDALLATMPEVSCDEKFARAREQLKRFDKIQPQEAPAAFQGTLRPYQKDGLGWLEFLQQFGLGGCLADDMGLGKTIQVLAMLEGQKNGARTMPSLIVVPRSLIFNWKQEAQRFTPRLRVLDWTGAQRAKDLKLFNEFDLILTTYGTVRREATLLKDYRFNYVILDEAQAIKNASTAAAKAARLLQSEHKLAMSGTPIENHLDELWSLFEFLNPGMLGRAASLTKLTKAAANASASSGTPKRNGSASDEHARRLLAHAVRPFILRRTKSQVARDLPEKTEQTIYCELESNQRKLYDELREHYRQSLLGKIQRDGLAKSKIQVLEALLRLRQAACHPGLIDKTRMSESSAKLDALLPHLDEVMQENHKALVFSQFTSLLSIVRERLDAGGITYEYLDGKTRDRQAKVERFQSDDTCKLFLISLKAGGVGLNLTAAEYVFLLDPWWNPAVEAQAIDRAHRIGQSRNVFAYRLIARDTVEERVLELQNTKRELADAIINADNSLIRGLKREDLELLLT